MPTLSEALNAAVKFHQTGNLAEAERLYRDILQSNPRHADAWHLLGLVAYQHGDLPAALESICRAIGLDPGQASYHNHLGEVYRAMRRGSEAEACCRRAVELKEDFAIAHNTLGAVLAEQGRFSEAIASFRQAVKHKPDDAQAHSNLGTALQSLEQLDEAIASFRRSIACDPGSAVAWNQLGTALVKQGKIEEAVDHYRKALRLNPRLAAAEKNLGAIFQSLSKWNEATACYQRALAIEADCAETHFNLGAILHGQGQLAMAVESYRNAIRANPQHAGAYNNLGAISKRQGKLTEAVECYQRALEFRPNFVEALNNLGNVFQLQGRNAEAMVCYEQTLRIDPNHAQAHYNRSRMLLAAGDFSNGWREYEWRLKCSDLEKQAFAEPRWQGEPLEGRTLLVHAEQGLGDVLQFIRYVPQLAHFGGKIIVEVPKPLFPLLGQSAIPGLVAKDAPLDRFDVQVPLMSLPLVCGTTLETIPSRVPYLAADPQWVEYWRGALGGQRTFQVGIAWQGSPTYQADRYRSIPLVEFAPLAQKGVELISLQKGPGSQPLTESTAPFRVRELVDLDGAHGPFMDTAAVIENLDLVITADTVIGHLAGALGVSVWVVLPSSPDWRWLYQREDSPWYPTMRLFRQTSHGDWPGVFRRMAEALAAKVAGGR
jgi:tetratricopeptide (TPR) repeat protein